MPFERGVKKAARARLPRFLEIRLGVDDFVAAIKKRALYMKRKEWAAANPEKLRELHKRWRQKHQAYYTERQREWRASHRSLLPAMTRKSLLKTKYGLTQEQYGELFAAQGGKCAICGRPPRTAALHVDHCHATGHIRGLLCHRCNYGLGYFSSAGALRRAAIYFDQGTGLYVPEKRRK